MSESDPLLVQLSDAYDNSDLFQDADTSLAVGTLMNEVVELVLSKIEGEITEEDLFRAMYKVGSITYVMGQLTSSDEDPSGINAEIPRDELGDLVKALVNGETVTLRLSSR